MSSPKLLTLRSRHHEYVIDGIMPKREVHILAAASGTGKTTFIVQLIDDLTEGNPIFGLSTTPTKIAYLCNDRSTDDLTRTFERVAPRHSIPRYSLLDAPEFDGISGAVASITQLRSLHPEVDFVVFDPISTEIKNVNDAQEVGRFLKSLTKIAQKLNMTILIIHHTSKTKMDAGYASPREKMAGCGAWGGYSNLNMIITPTDETDPTNEKCTLHILPRNAANLSIDMVKDEFGCLLIAPKAEDTIPPEEKMRTEDTWFVTDLPRGRFHHSTAATGLNKKAGPLSRVLKRWIAAGWIVKEPERGWYLKP